jgi:hypothetical protein
VEVGPRYLSRHQVDVVVEGQREQHIGFPNAGVALHVDVYPVALNQLDAFKLGSAAEPTRFFVYQGDLVAAFYQRCNCS